MRDQRVIVDYDGCRLGFSAKPEDASAEDQRLVECGYVAHKMTWNQDKRQYYVNATVNGKEAHLAVSTVTHDEIDTDFAQMAKIELGPILGEAAGPKGRCWR